MIQAPKTQEPAHCKQVHISKPETSTKDYCEGGTPKQRLVRKGCYFHAKRVSPTLVVAQSLCPGLQRKSQGCRRGSGPVHRDSGSILRSSVKNKFGFAENYIVLLKIMWSGTMTGSCWFPQVKRGEYALNALFGVERVWDGHGTDTQRNVNSEILHSLVWNGGVLNGI